MIKYVVKKYLQKMLNYYKNRALELQRDLRYTDYISKSEEQALTYMLRDIKQKISKIKDAIAVLDQFAKENEIKLIKI